MKVTYALQLDDLWQLNKFIVNRTPASRVRGYAPLLVVPVCLAALADLAQLPWQVCVLVGAGLPFVWVPFCLWLTKRRLTSQARRQAGWLQKRTVSLGAGGVRQVTAVVDSLFYWGGVTEIVSNRRHLLFFMGDRQALIIPLAAFAGAEDADRFAEAARRLKAGLAVEAVPAQTGVWPPPPRGAER